VQLKVEYTIKEKQIKAKLTQMRKELKEKSLKRRDVQMIDYWEINNLFGSYYKELAKYAKKFAKVKYTKTWQIEEDLDTFDKLLKKFNTELDTLSNKKITVSIEKALDFVEDEIRGKSEILTSLNDSIHDFAEIEQIANELRTKMNVLGADVIPKHVGFIQKMVNAISGFLRKWTVKFIMGVVFIFTF
jgi:DNA repair ATPase RecN